MLADDVGDLAVEFVFQRQIDALFHMGDDDERAHRRRQVVVGVVARMHVFREIFGLHEFADIVEVGADPAEGGVRPDGLRSRFRQVRHGEAVVVGAGGLHAQALEKRMVQVTHLQPGNIGGDFKQRLQHRQNPAHDDCGPDPCRNGREALEADHPPVGLRRSLPDDRADLPECRGEDPRGDSDIHSRADQPAATSHLQRDIDGDESGDEGNHQKNRVDAADQKGTPEAREDRRVEAVVAAEQNRQYERSERVGDEERGQLEIDVPRRSLEKRHFDRGQLHQKYPEQQAKPRIDGQRLRVVDPQLHDRRHEDEQAQEKFFRRLVLLAVKDQNRKAADESRQEDRPDRPAGLEGFGKLVLLDGPAAFPAVQPLSDKPPFSQEVPHGIQILLSLAPRCSL